MKPSVLLRKSNDTPDRGRMQVFCGGRSPFSAKFFPGGEYKKARGEFLPSAHRIGASAAAAVVAAAVVIAAAVVAAPAAAAEQDDNKDDDPQAAVAALDTIIWPGRKMGAWEKAPLYKIFSQKARSIVAISARVALRWGSSVRAEPLVTPLITPCSTAQAMAGRAQLLRQLRSA